MKTICKSNKHVTNCNDKCSTCFTSNLKVVSLYGRNKKGKTPTLCSLISKMCLFTSCFEYIKHRERKTNALDKTYLFRLKGTNKTIGVTTTGDICYCMAEEFDWLKQANNSRDCDLYICASHESDSTADWLKARTINGYLLRYSKWEIEKNGTVPNKTIISEDVLNFLQVENLYEIIVNLL